LKKYKKDDEIKYVEGSEQKYYKLVESGKLKLVEEELKEINEEGINYNPKTKRFSHGREFNNAFNINLRKIKRLDKVADD